MLPIFLNDVWTRGSSEADELMISIQDARKIQAKLDKTRSNTRRGLKGLRFINKTTTTEDANELWRKVESQFEQLAKDGFIFREDFSEYIGGYSPLGAKGIFWCTFWGTNRVMEFKVLEEIAKARGKTIAQVCLRWVHEQGTIVLVKRFKKEQKKENLKIFGWAWSDEIFTSSSIEDSLQMILRQQTGPFKSAEEFWDGEI
ncbi:hypothetical protein NE237_022719 [Protea cynaroides]|uniref:NADP-dependent oxidoreductase domain-containing protein n=1 Tax=Protea cynaroides TaxID=273540 RepID=A0A9Q0K5J3_9MAGN|nr:hypothetical protein NE237_022719 [Protea cynaroides]